MNILAIRNDRFGELLLNIPALRALKESYPEAALTLAVRSDTRELAQCIEYSDRVVVWDDNFRRNLRKQRFDICVVLNPTKEAHWHAFFAGIPIRVGYNRKWGFLLTHKIPDNKNLGLKHEVEYNLDLVGLILGNKKEIASGTSCPRNDGVLRLPRNDKYEFLAGALAIHPYTSDSLKQWPLERFMELAQRIAREIKVKVVLVGRAEGQGQSPFPRLRSGLPAVAGTVPSSIDMGEGIVNLVNKTSLVELAQILRQCRLLVSCDSGPMHLAASVGTPVIALFRNDLPGKTAQRWGPWGKGHIVIEKGRLEDISVEEVLDKVKNIRYS